MRRTMIIMVDAVKSFLRACVILNLFDSGNVKTTRDRVAICVSAIGALVTAWLYKRSRGCIEKSTNSIKELVLPNAAATNFERSCDHNKLFRTSPTLSSRNRDGYLSCEFRNLESRITPLLVFVNVQSGSRQGPNVMKLLGQYLHKLQIVELGERCASPEAALRWWSRYIKNFRVLVCGGDGTVAWVLGTLDKLQLHSVPVGILPLGTGNDLAQSLGYGGCFMGRNVLRCLQTINQAHISLLDQWTVAFPLASSPCHLSSESTGENALEHTRGTSILESTRPNLEPKPLYSYCGIGIDAAVTLDFHRMRAQWPRLFFSRLMNKVWYTVIGFREAWRRRSPKLAHKICLRCDGRVVELPPAAEGVIILNVNSHLGGVDHWGKSDSGMCPNSTVPSLHDKKLEVVYVSYVLDMGAAAIGIPSLVRRLTQAEHVEIHTDVEIPVQVDGEPFLLGRGANMEIAWKRHVSVISGSSAHGRNGVGVATKHS